MQVDLRRQESMVKEVWGLGERPRCEDDVFFGPGRPRAYGRGQFGAFRDTAGGRCRWLLGGF